MEDTEVIGRIRDEFPILERKTYGERPLVYLDNTASSQTPREVLAEIDNIYTLHKANVHRGVHLLSREATDLQEASRRSVAEFINAASPEEVIFTRGTTEGINLVASSFGGEFRDGDEIILTVMEHHANIVPWQLLRRHADIRIRVVPITDDGALDLEEYRRLFNPRTRLASFCHVSNVLGTLNPVAEMIAIAHSHGVPVLVDGAQAAPHFPIDVRALDADFYVFSSHKMYGPTGIGVLYGKRDLLEKMPPYQGGGEMIKHVSFEHTTFADLPFKFEAGTPDYVGIGAFPKALDFIRRTGWNTISEQEKMLLEFATEEMERIPGMKIYGTTPDKEAVISFNVGTIHNYDLGLMLDRQGVAVRTGHHCAQPLMERLGVPGTVRASFAVYNTLRDAELFIEALRKAVAMLS
ncbi:MAG: cysteine desulfurase [Muribaculaceae bacterium]|nr:cysteine desulfurase [Muribaculaceae bacterium]